MVPRKKRMMHFYLPTPTASPLFPLLKTLLKSILVSFQGSDIMCSSTVPCLEGAQYWSWRIEHTGSEGNGARLRREAQYAPVEGCKSSYEAVQQQVRTGKAGSDLLDSIVQIVTSMLGCHILGWGTGRVTK